VTRGRGRPARVVALAGLLLLAACGNGPTEPGGGEATPGDCDECAAQLADLRGALDHLDGVRSVDRLDYDPDGGLGDEAGLRVDVVRAADADPAELTDRVARTVWRSEVAPLSEVGVNVLDAPGQSMLDGASTAFEFTLDRDDLQQRWGPRGAAP
jgi:hypothetical protein